MADILVVDDDQAVAAAFEQFLGFEGHTCRLANSAAAAARALAERSPDIVMMDIRMPGMDGLTALQQFRQEHPNLCVVMMTAYGTSQTSIDAIRSGAFEYLTKPLDLDDLRRVIGRALAARAVAADAGAQDADAPAIALVGESPPMLEVYKMIGRLATNSVPALVVGERGTGKRLVIATIHANSGRAAAPLATLAAGVVSEPDLTAALFGNPDATLSLTDVDQLPAAHQSMVAQALTSARLPGAVRPVARVLAATDADLAEAVRAGGFSRELFDELSIITIRLPPLRERRGDIPLLVAHLIQRFNSELSRTIKGADRDASDALAAYSWPGNVAELARAIKRASIVARSEVITLADLGDSLSERQAPGRADGDGTLQRAVRDALHDRLVQAVAPAPSPYHQIVDVVETTLVTEALAITNGNQVKAAEILGVNRATLRKKMPLEP